jgi:hypothetical protein
MIIYDQKIPGRAVVIIYDHWGHEKPTGRYQIYKLRQLPNGKYRHSYAYRHQKTAAIAHAQKWISSFEEVQQ